MAGLRVKVALDEERVSEMLRGLTAATLGDEFGPTAGGLLACLGELASLSFMPATSGNSLIQILEACCLDWERTETNERGGSRESER